MTTSSVNIFVLRALPVGSDSRVMRWADIYAPIGKVFLAGWGKSCNSSSLEILSYRPQGGYINFILFYPIFMVACFFSMLRQLKRGDILVCVDLETIVFSIFAAKIKGARVHFDVADPFALAKPVPFKFFWLWLECLYIKHSDFVTVPHQVRLQFYPNIVSNYIEIVENVPSLKPAFKANGFLADSENGCIMTFGYFGNLEEHRGLELLLDFVQSQPETRLIIAGRGLLTSKILDVASYCSRVKFLGSFNPNDLATLVADVDVYWSLYHKTKILHKYATPNKYFEHLVLGIPIIISSDTPYAHNVLMAETGWVIDDDIKPLYNWYELYKNNRNAFEKAANNARSLWESKYSNWLSTQQDVFLERWKDHFG